MKLPAGVAVCGLLVMAGALAGCSKRDRESPLIIGGQRVDPHNDKDTAVVAVHIGGRLCTGTLIAPRFVLTARHCVEHGGDRFVTFGVRSNEGPRTSVRIHVPPPSPDRTSDIAVLELAEASTVSPIPVNLGASGLDRISEIRVVGFGVTGSSRSDQGIKRTGSVRATTTASYVVSVGTDGTCFGDSGGPALAIVDGREQIVGVTSHGTARRCEDGQGRYVRTDVHRAFLQQFVGGGATPPSPNSDGVAGIGNPGTASAGAGAAGTASAGAAGTASAGASGGSGSAGSVVVVSSSASSVTVSSANSVTVTVVASQTSSTETRN